MLAGAERDGRHTVLNQPVGVESAVGEHGGRGHTQRLGSAARVDDRGCVIGNIKRGVLRLAGELNARRFSAGIRHGCGRAKQGRPVSVGVRGGEGRVGASRFAFQVDIIGDHVGRVTRRDIVFATENADVACSVALRSHDLAEPAFAVDVRDGDGGDEGGRDALVRRDPGVGGFSVNVRFKGLSADRAGDEFGGNLGIHIKTHDRALEVGGINVVRALQAALLANREEQGDGRVGEVVLQQCFHEGDEDGTAGAIVATQTGGRVGNDAVALPFGFRTRADRNDVHMCGEHNARAAPCAGKIGVEVAGLGRQRDFFMHRVIADGRCRNAQ